MKNKSHRAHELAQPSDEDIRHYAYQIYEQNNCTPGHDLAHWFEAAAFLKSNPPERRHGSHHNPPIHASERSEHAGVS